ncbi:MAG: GDSL-type esterase/lipase family protein [Pseudomonadota bacterium]
MSNPAPRSEPRLGRRLAFSFAVLLIVGMLAEGAARLFGPPVMPPDASHDAADGQEVPGEPNMLGDALAGWRSKVGQQHSFGVPGGTTVSPEGLRGVTSLGPKAAGERRVLLLGDSSVFGVLVRDEDTFGARLEAALRRQDPGIRVLNGGCPGYSSWQALAVLRHRLAATAPDLVVVATLWSDTQGAERPDSVRFGGPARRLLYQSRAFLVLGRWVEALRYGPGARPPAPEPVSFGLQPLAAPTTRVPIGEYGRNLRALAREARRLGGEVAYLVLPCVRDPADGRVGDFRDRWRQVMRETAAAEGAPLADAPPAFASTNPGAMFLDEVHPSPAGHARIAEVLSAALGEWTGGVRH